MFLIKVLSLFEISLNLSTGIEDTILRFKLLGYFKKYINVYHRSHSKNLTVKL